MAEANDDIRSTKLAILEAIAWILRTASELRRGAMEKLEVYFGNALGGGFATRPSAEATAGMLRGGLGGFRYDLEVLLYSLHFSFLLSLLYLRPVYMASAWDFTTCGVSLCARSAERSPLSGTERLLDI
jgi:hypothetical protein